MSQSDAETEAMRAAIAGVYAQHSPEQTSSRGVITGFIVITEVIGDDGQPWLKRIGDEGPMWRTLGMLTAVSDDLREAMRATNNDPETS